MSISMNRSSEATTQLNLPVSYLINSSTLDDYSLNSFYSPRAGSVTVIGKRIFSNSCISPNTTSEPSKFPIAIKSITRIKRQTTQVKLLLKRKTSKVKFPEQPAPPVSLKPNRRTSSSTLKKPREKQIKKILKPEKTSPNQIIPSFEHKFDNALTERSSVRIKQIIQKSIKKEIKNKKKIEKKRDKDKVLKIYKKIEMDERNSKIRIENSLKFKKEKFTPKAAWGVDERKFEDMEKGIKEVEGGRVDRKSNRKSPAQRNTLGLSYFWEVAEEAGFRPRSSSIQNEDVPVCIKKNVKKIDPRVKSFIKSQKRRRKEHKKNKIIEDIQKETKRITCLKLLDLKQSETSRERKKSKTKRIKILLRPRKSIFNQETPSNKNEFHLNKAESLSKKPEFPYKNDEFLLKNDEFLLKNDEFHLKNDKFLLKNDEFLLKPNEFLQKNTEFDKNDESLFKNDEKSSDFVFEPDSALKQDLSSFTQDSVSEMTQKSLETLSAVIKIQYWIRKHLKKLKKFKDHANEISTNSNYNDEDTEVQQILNSWTGSVDAKSSEPSTKPFFSNHQLSNLEKMRQKEINDLVEVAKQLSQDTKLVDSLTEMIGNRYQNIAEMLKHSTHDMTHFEQSQNESLNKEGKVLDFSISSEKSFQGMKNEKNDIKVLQELKIQDLSFEEPARCELNPFKHPYISLNSPNSEEDNDQVKVGKSLFFTISPTFIENLSETIISRLLLEIVNPRENPSKPEKILKIDKDVVFYIDQLFFYTPSFDLKLKMIQSIHIDPNELLIQIQHNEKSTLSHLSPSPYEIIPTEVFESLDSLRLSPTKDLQSSQTAHDKMLFDSCNELLQNYRPYKTKGEPAPWDYSNRVMTGDLPDIDLVKTEIILKVVKFNSLEAGKIFDSSFSNNSFAKEDGAIQNLREEKIGSLIVESIQNGEEKWIDYQFEESQVCIDLADWVFDLVSGECADVLSV